MRALGVAIGLVLLAGLTAPASAQLAPPSSGPPSPNGNLGNPNTQNPTFLLRPDPNGPFREVPQGTPGSRESFPFTDEPHRLNNAHPMLPNAGLGHAVRRVWVAPKPVVMQVYVPVPEGIPAKYQTMYAEIPGFYVTQTTTGNIYPERWVIEHLNVGLYRWRKAPAQFVPR